MAARVGTSRALGSLVAVLLALPAAAQAQANSHVVVVRETAGVPDAEAEQLDATLLAEVARTSGLGTPELASVELSEIELAAGCSDTAAMCLRAVARMIGAQSVLVRSLRRTPAGLALVLTWFDATSADEPQSIEAAAPDVARLRAELPRNVRRLFRVPEPVVAAPDGAGDAAPSGAPARGVPRVTADDEDPGVPVVPLLIAVGGAATLAVGVVFGLLSADAQDRYAGTTIRTAADADTALAALDEARTRALVANVLYGVGGTLALVGASWFVIELATGGPPSPDARASALATSWGFAPLPGGALFSLRGNL